MLKCSAGLLLTTAWFLAFAAGCLFRPAPEKSSVSVIRKDGWVAPVFLPSRPSPEEEQAGLELARALHKMSGLRPGVAPEPAGSPPGFYIGKTRLALRAGGQWAGLDRDGIFMAAERDRIILCGPGDESALFAVRRFLQKHGGVRWYLPGELGEHIPPRSSWSVPAFRETEEPDFLCRSFFASAGGAAWKEWSGRNLLRRRFRFSHNLGNIITAEDYEEHPGWFPLVNGRRYRPDPEGLVNWQPNLLHPGVVRRAVSAARDFFGKHPDAVSFSIGANDTTFFGDYPEDAPHLAPRRYFRSQPDYSALVFQFTNQVAREVSQTHPGKYLGALAYLWWENTPPFPVASNVIPVIAADRSQWYDPAFKKSDMALVREWTARGPEIVGTWDYYYGDRYVIPRVCTRIIGGSIPALRRAGVRAFFAELNPLWGFDAVKAWLAAQLLWDASQQPEALLDDFYANFFGETAGPMRRFFQECEKTWMAQPDPAFWIKYYKHAHQPELFPVSRCRELRRILDEAENRADSDLTRRRARLVSDTFKLTESAAALHEARSALERLPGAPAKDSAKLTGLLSGYLEARRAFQETVKNLRASHPLHAPLPEYGFMLNPDPVTKRLARLIENKPDVAGLPEEVKKIFSIIREAGYCRTEEIQAWTAAYEHSRKSPDWLKNGGFEEPFSGQGAPFEGWLEYSHETAALHVARAPDAARNGSWGVEIKGAYHTDLSQTVPVRQGHVYLAAARARGTIQPAGAVSLAVVWLDAQGRRAGATRWGLLPPGSTGGWRMLAVCGKAPDDAVWARLRLRVTRQNPQDFVHFDDVSFRPLPVSVPKDEFIKTTKEKVEAGR